MNILQSRAMSTYLNTYKVHLKLILILILLISIPAVTAKSDFSRPFRELQIETGDYVEYRITTSVFRQWNFSIVEGNILTSDGIAYYERDIISTIIIRLLVQNQTSDDQFVLTISYYADTQVGYDIDTSFLVHHSFSSGECTIQNGSLSGMSGQFYLFKGNNFDTGIFCISRLDSINITADFMLSNINIEIMNMYQEVTTYNCTSYDPVDAETPHSRRYDSDTGLLLHGSGGFSDAILTGLANITYAVGEIILTDTSLSLGPSVPAPIVTNSIFIGLVGLGIFLTCYIAIYLSKKRKYGINRSRKSKHKRKNTRINTRIIR